MRSSNNLVEPENLKEFELRLEELMVDKAVSPHKIKQVMYAFHNDLEGSSYPSRDTLKNKRPYFKSPVKKRLKVRSFHKIKRKAFLELKVNESVRKDRFFTNIDRIHAMERFALLHTKFEDDETSARFRMTERNTITPFHTKPLKRKLAILSEAFAASFLAYSVGFLIIYCALKLVSG